MMQKPRILILAAALLAAGATPARADGFLTPFIGFNFGGDSSNCASLTSCEDKRLNWGASFGTVSGVFGFEEDIAYSSQFFGKTPGGDNAMLQEVNRHEDALASFERALALRPKFAEALNNRGSVLAALEHDP